MKRRFLLFAVLLWSAAFAGPIQDRRIDPKALTALLAKLEIPSDEGLIEATQKRWLRKPGQERWEMAEISAEKRLFVLNWADEQGFFAAWKPMEKSYDKALILGATTGNMERRLAFLVDLWNEGVRFNEIVWLTGERPLDPRIDGLTDLCNKESEAARILWNEAALPNDMRSLAVVFVAVPMKEGGKRPNTADTIVAWLEMEPEPCKALFISDQPFCGYQFAVIKALVPDEVLFDVAGERAPSGSHPAAAAIILDSVARWIYQDSEIRNR